MAFIDVLINFDVLFSCLFTCYSSLTSDLYFIYAENATAVALHGGRGGLAVSDGAEGGGEGGKAGAESVLIDSTLMLIFKQKQTNLVIFPKFY